MSFSVKQLRALIVVPAVTGSISFTSSLTIIIMILRSSVKLSTTYRRLIFAVSVFDLLQSLTQVASTLPMPASMIWGAIGNNTTCELQGFLAVIGAGCSILYSLSITVYFLLVIKFNISNEIIKKKYEPFLHAIPITYVFTVAFYIYATSSYNPSGTLCWISHRPTNCNLNSEVECVTSLINLKRWLAAGIPVFTAFILNCVIMFVLWLTEYTNFIKNRNRRLSFIGAPSSPGWRINNDSQDEEETGCLACCSKKNYLDSSPNALANVNASPLAAHLSRPSNAAMKRRRSITNRALAYIIGYLLTYVFTVTYRLFENFGVEPPYTIIFFSRLLYPLQGLFNVLIYTYPYVLLTRQKFSEYSWLKAFWEVVKSGGDSDQIPVSRSARRRRSSAARRLTFPLKRNDLPDNG